MFIDEIYFHLVFLPLYYLLSPVLLRQVIFNGISKRVGSIMSTKVGASNRNIKSTSLKKSRP